MSSESEDENADKIYNKIGNKLKNMRKFVPGTDKIGEFLDEKRRHWEAGFNKGRDRIEFA